MQRQFRRLQMPAQRWSAVDGRKFNMRTLETLVAGGEISKQGVSRLLLPDEQKVFGMDLTPGALGCALSHMHIWIDVMRRHGAGEFDGDEDTMFLVAEDDCEFLPGFSPDVFQDRLTEVPEDWQVVYLGGVDSMGLQPLLQVAPGVRRIYNGSRETTAYVMNIRGVRSALKVCFPLMWQLDTQLTLRGRICDGLTLMAEDGSERQLAYTIDPMSYLFWPPLVEQNKKDFQTDVQKDEHPKYVNGQEVTTSYTVKPDPWPDEATTASMLSSSDLKSLSRRYALVGSWNDWNFFELVRNRSDSLAFHAEIEVPAGEEIQFQMVRDLDWNQRIVPAPDSRIALATSGTAHGRNWKLQVPLTMPLMLHINLDPTGTSKIDYVFGEPRVFSLSRRFALVGSWNAWGQPESLVLEEGSGAAFTASLWVPAGQDVEFQLLELPRDLEESQRALREGEWHRRIFPSIDGSILGPSAEGHGKNWKLPAPPERSVLHVLWDPTGRRTLRCHIDQILD